MTLVRVLFCVLLLAGCSGKNVWRVGAAKEVITPDRPVWLAGYSRDGLSEGVHDDIWARGMAIDDGERTVLILTADLIGLYLTDVNDIRDSLVTHRLPRDHIVLASTHNHSGPDMLGLWNIDRGKSGVDFDYLKQMKRQLVDVGRRAVADSRPAILSVSRNEIRGISMNHRDEDLLDYEIVTLGDWTASPSRRLSTLPAIPKC